MSLLIDDYPLIVLPALAEEIGLNEAIFLQQLNYWSQPKLNQGIVDEQGRRWIYNSVEAWRAQFRFFTERTLRRTISNLENLGLILSTLRYKRNPMDRTKSYAICQENVAALECSRNEKQAAAPKRSKPLFNVAPMPDGLTEEEAKGQSVECMQPNWPDAENQASEDFSSNLIKGNAAKGQSVECMWPKWPDGSGQNGHMEEEAAKPDAARADGLSSHAREKTTAKTTTKTTAAAIDRDGEDTRTRVREEIKTSMAAAEENKENISMLANGTASTRKVRGDSDSSSARTPCWKSSRFFVTPKNGIASRTLPAGFAAPWKATIGVRRSKRRSSIESASEKAQRLGRSRRAIHMRR